MLQRARGVDDVEIELEDIIEAARQSRMIRNPYKSILQRKYRPQLVIASIFMIFQQFDVSLELLESCLTSVWLLSGNLLTPPCTSDLDSSASDLMHIPCLQHCSGVKHGYGLTALV